MFQSARLKLTFWYFIIITSISLILTLPLYFSANHAFTQLENVQATHTSNIPVPHLPFSAKTVPEARTNLTIILFTTNAVVIFLGSILGYFLAGRTLKPIKIMVDEQNRFISDASHELRTPLTALHSELEFMKMEYSLPEKVKDHITSTLEEVTNMQVLTNELLLLSKNQYIRPNTVGEVSLLDVLETAIKKIVPLAREKKITIDNQIKDVTLRINHQSLSQVFVVLLDNAIKYSDYGKKITVTSITASDRVTINFIDEGIGINKENLKHVFERFYRGDKSRSKSSAAGYGLGLAIAIKIIDSYKGTIHVKSAIDKGSTFSVMLPLSYV